MIQIPQSASRVVMLKLFTTGTTTAATGKTVAVTISKNGGAFANPNAGATNATEVSSGWYKVTLDATDTGTVGDLVVRGTATGCDDTERLFGVVKATTGGLTALPDTAATTNASLLTSGTGTDQLSVSSGKVLLQATQSGVTIPTVTVVTNQLTAAQVATGVWQDATAGDFTVSSSIGKSLYTSGVVPGGSGGLFIAGTNAATTVTTSFTTTFTGSLTGSVGSVTGAVGSVTGAVGSVTGNVGGNVTGSVGSVAAGGIAASSFAAGAIDAAAIAANAIGASELAADAASEIASAVRTELAAELARVDVATGTRLADASYTAPLDAVGTRAAVGLASANLDAQLAAIDDAVDTEVAALVLSVGAGLGAAVAALPTAAQVADKVLGRNLASGSDGGRTVKDALRFLRNRWVRTGVALSVYEEDDVTLAWTSVLTTSDAIDPVSESNPP